MVGRVISWHLSNSSINSILKKFQYSSIPFHSNGQTPPWYGRMIHSYSLHGDELREYHHRGRLMYRKRIRYSLSSAAGIKLTGSMATSFLNNLKVPPNFSYLTIPFLLLH